jgi:hypothetical protein
MSDESSSSFEDVQKAIDAMAIRTRIVELKGLVAGGKTLTHDQSTELAALEVSLATLTSEK